MLIDAVLPFGSIDREFLVEEKEWETGKVFEKRWVFGIETHIPVTHIAVG